MPDTQRSTTENAVHVIPTKTRWIVTRVQPQYNAAFDDGASAVSTARSLAQRDGTLMLVHLPSGEVETRENYRITSPENR